ncbi:MAG TPA: TolC family protein [Synechococcales cyanobacterium M55_K2018_004]|nr:TolC family protein [Synechococcales cyanobacterium M55_K2018_004]
MHSSYALVFFGVGVAIALNPPQAASAADPSMANPATPLEVSWEHPPQSASESVGHTQLGRLLEAVARRDERLIGSPTESSSRAQAVYVGEASVSGAIAHPASTLVAQTLPASDPTQVPLQPGSEPASSADTERTTPSATEQPPPATPADGGQPGGVAPAADTTPASGGRPGTGGNSTPRPTPASTDTVIDRLNPSPNPLAVPTRPEEVRITVNQPITLQQALELAQRNNRPLQTAILELESSRQAVREAQASLLPTVAANANITNSGRDVQVFQGPFLPFATEFRTATSVGASLQVTYPLFTSGRRLATISAAEAQARFQALQVEVLAEQIRLDVSTEYYDMQQRDEEVRIARDALQQAERSLRDAEALERAGVGTRFDVLQAQVDVANSRQELTQALSQQAIARRRLVQRLGLAENANISAADPVAVAADWALSLEDSVVLAYRNRAELEQQLVQREIAQERRRVALAALGPEVSVFAQYNLAVTLDQDNGFRDDYQVGARVNLNLYDGGAARARARQQEINQAIAETRFADLRQTVRFQVEQAYSTLQANRENIRTTRLGVEQAREALRLARLRFQAGVGTQSDVLRAQTELTRAEVNQLNAILGYNRSLVLLQRAISNFPEGNLAASP